MDETAPHVMEAQFDELIRTMLRMQPRHREVSVRDPEGQVEATCGPDGRLAKVTVEPRWQDKIEPGDLSTVLLTTIAEAQFEASGLNDDDRPEPTDEEVGGRQVFRCAGCRSEWTSTQSWTPRNWDGEVSQEVARARRLS